MQVRFFFTAKDAIDAKEIMYWQKFGTNLFPMVKPALFFIQIKNGSIQREEFLNNI